MFWFNVGYRLDVARDTEAIDRVIVLGGLKKFTQLDKASLSGFKGMILDPQLYLADEDRSDSAKLFERLSTYSWFSQYQGENANIETVSRLVLEAQIALGCTHVLLPTPSIKNREDEGATQGTWLDIGTKIAEELEISQPLVLSIAIREAVLNDAAFNNGGFLDWVVDQCTSRGGFSGVYFVILRSGDEPPLDISNQTARAYLHISKRFAEAGVSFILPNFADVFGLVCLGVGATELATGQFMSQRRLSIPGLKDAPGGKSYPHFYSHRIMAELRTETDLDRVVEKKLVRRVSDLTDLSRPLIDELKRGGSAKNLPAWAESQNNTKMAAAHFATRLATEEKTISRLGSEDKIEYLRSTLITASANANYVKQRIGKVALKGRFVDCMAWLEHLDLLTE